MKFYVPKTPKFVPWLFPKRIWAFSRNNPSVYLTFDDGPIPEITPWVLDVLKQHGAKATFFCIGDNVRKYPEIFNRIKEGGHTVGNHTFNHLRGTTTELKVYLENVSAFDKEAGQQTVLFRPPYGRITQKQAKALQQKGYQLVMWDVLAYDWDAKVSEETCLQNVLNNIQAGSIVVFHDSLKASKNMKFALPRVLEFIKSKGWKCEVISPRSY